MNSHTGHYECVASGTGDEVTIPQMSVASATPTIALHAGHS